MLSNIRSGLDRLLRRLPRHFTVAFGVVIVLYFLDITSIINCRERDAYDFRMKHRPVQRAHRNIVILAIDDLSLQALGPWPWRRRVHAELIRTLKTAGAKTVFFDVLFPEKSQDPEDDKIFAEAIRETGNVVLSFHFLSRKPFKPLFPITEFKSALHGLGYADVESDLKDGVVRTILPFVDTGGQRYFHSAVAVFLSLFDRLEERLDWEKTFSKQCGKRELLVNYPGGLSAFQNFSVGEVFEKSKTEEGRGFLKQVFEDKIVLLGDVATGSSDLRTTPIQPMTPGIVIQASVLNTLLTGQYLIAIPKPWNYLLAFFLSWIIAWFGQKLRPQWTFLATIVQMTLYIVINCLIFNYLRIVFQLPMPLVAMFTVFVLSLFLKYMDVRVESDFLERELSMASKIQQSLLPASEYKSAQMDASFRLFFYEQVGGDLYDWLDLGDGRVTLCLGDVSGKGVPAALYMSRAINELRHQVLSHSSPGEILSRLNHSLSQGETSGMFLTLFFVIVDFNDSKIRFANAGHDPMVFFRKKNGKADLITEASGLPIGIMDDQTFETGEIDFEPGDLLLLTSDGIKEQKNPKGEIFGSERLQRSVEVSAAEMGSDGVISRVMADALRFSEGRSHHDDRTLVCAKMLAV